MGPNSRFFVIPAPILIGINSSRNPEEDLGIASAGGQLLGAAFAFIEEMFPQREEKEQTLQLTETLRKRISECFDKDEEGRLKMTITLPDESVLDNMAKSLAQILGSSGWRP